MKSHYLATLLLAAPNLEVYLDASPAIEPLITVELETLDEGEGPIIMLVPKVEVVGG